MSLPSARRRAGRSSMLAQLLAAVLGCTGMAGGGATWVLWVEAPANSDQWSVAAIPQPRFETRDECDRRARNFNETVELVGRMEGTTGDARDVFSCLPDTVDPRPEGALRR
jgi:hypothetical protein